MTARRRRQGSVGQVRECTGPAMPQHTYTQRAHNTHSPARLPVPVGRHPGLCHLVIAPSAHHTTPHHTTPHHTTPHHTTPHHTTPHHTTPHHTTPHHTTPHHTTPHHTTPHSTMGQNSVYGSIAAWHGVKRLHSVACCGILWCSVVSCGMVCCGAGWCAERVVTKWQWLVWCCTQEHASQALYVSDRAVCEVCFTPGTARLGIRHGAVSFQGCTWTPCYSAC